MCSKRRNMVLGMLRDISVSRVAKAQTNNGTPFSAKVQWVACVDRWPYISIYFEWEPDRTSLVSYARQIANTRTRHQRRPYIDTLSSHKHIMTAPSQFLRSFLRSVMSTPATALHIANTTAAHTFLLSNHIRTPTNTVWLTPTKKCLLPIPSIRPLTLCDLLPQKNYYSHIIRSVEPFRLDALASRAWQTSICAPQWTQATYEHEKSPQQKGFAVLHFCIFA